MKFCWFIIIIPYMDKTINLNSSLLCPSSVSVSLWIVSQNFFWCSIKSDPSISFCNFLFYSIFALLILFFFKYRCFRDNFEIRNSDDFQILINFFALIENTMYNSEYLYCNGQVCPGDFILVLKKTLTNKFRINHNFLNFQILHIYFHNLHRPKRTNF